MYPKTENSYSEDAVCEQMIWESQVNRLHNLAEELSRKVRHISSEMLSDVSGAKNPTQATQLNRELDVVIAHFENVIGGIIN